MATKVQKRPGIFSKLNYDQFLIMRDKDGSTNFSVFLRAHKKVFGTFARSIINAGCNVAMLACHKKTSNDDDADFDRYRLIAAAAQIAFHFTAISFYGLLLAAAAGTLCITQKSQ